MSVTAFRSKKFIRCREGDNMAASAKGLVEGEELECAYCFGNESEMSHPRRLPCGHVYCLKCIEDDVAANKILQCPKCR